MEKSIKELAREYTRKVYNQPDTALGKALDEIFIAGYNAKAESKVIDQNMIDYISEWAYKTFPNQTVAGKLSHTIDEIREIGYEYLREDKAKLLLEFADVHILMANTLDICGFTLEDLVNAIHTKMEINKKRIWGDVNYNGYHAHVNED